MCLASWAIPGAGHLWLGRRSKGLIFLVALPLMFAIGVAIRGRLFPFELSDPLVGLAAVADLGIGADLFHRGGARLRRRRRARGHLRIRQRVPDRRRAAQHAGGHRRLRRRRWDGSRWQSHLLLLAIFAFFVSLVFAVIAKDEVREQLRFGGMMFGGFLASARRARLADVSVPAC